MMSSQPSRYEKSIYERKRKSDHEFFMNRSVAVQQISTDSSDPNHLAAQSISVKDQSSHLQPEQLGGSWNLSTNSKFLGKAEGGEQAGDTAFSADWEASMFGDPVRTTLPRRGKLVTFYRNGDPHFKGLQTSVSHKAFLTFETLLVWLNEKIPTTAGVKFIFSLPEGNEIRDVGQFVGGRSYVVSSVRKVINVPYGDSRERFWRNRSTAFMDQTTNTTLTLQQPLRLEPVEIIQRGESSAPLERPVPSINRVGGDNLGLISTPRPRSYQGEFYQTPGSNARPRILVIRSNTDRTSRQKVIFNPQTSQTYEDVLADIRNMLNIQFPPVTGLFVAVPPYTKVLGISHLSRDLRNYNEFLACGREGNPLELHADKNVSPARRALSLDSGNKESFVPGNRYDIFSKDTDVLSDGMNNWSLQQGELTVTEAAKQQTSESNDVRKTVKPYRKELPDVDRVKVYIHGHMREFFSSRYGSTKSNDSSLPDRKLLLEWVFGYNGQNLCSNLFVLPTGELIYHMGTVAVIFDAELHKQKFYTEHSEDITCMTVHPDSNATIVATGQHVSRKASDCKAYVRIWDWKTLATFAVLGQDNVSGSISSLCFSEQSGSAADGSYLLTVDHGNMNTISVWDWNARHVVARTTIPAEDLQLKAAFHPQEFTTVITYGHQQVTFWKLFWEQQKKPVGKGRLLRDKYSGTTETELMTAHFTSLAFGLNGDVITGDSSGRILIWSKDSNNAFTIAHQESESLRHAHQKAVSTLCILDDGTLISGGGSDIKAWDSMNHYKFVKERSLPVTCGLIRTAVPLRRGALDGALYIGTSANTVLFGSLQDKMTTIIQGHSEELWAIAAHPSECQFVTAGYDQWVMAWNAITPKLLWKIQSEKPCVSVTYDSYGQRLAVGTTAGRFIVLDAGTGGHLVSVQIGSQSLDTIRFSPDNRFLAVGCQDTNVYIYETSDDCRSFRRYKSGTLKGHENFVSQLDWSRDSHYLQTVSGDYDLLIWDVIGLNEIPPETARDVDWMTQTCSLGYDVIGAWSNLRDGDDINTLARSQTGNCVAVGNNRGTVALYRYPCAADRPEHFDYHICSGHVTAVCFVGMEDRYLVTSGGNHAAVMQWRLID